MNGAFQDALPVHDKIADLIPEVPDLPTETVINTLLFCSTFVSHHRYNITSSLNEKVNGHL